MTTRQRIEQRVQSEICSVCVFLGSDEKCYTPDPHGCAIIRNLDAAIRVVATTHSDRMDPYVAKVREAVCEHCAQRDPQGRCRLQVRADCALDDYMGLLVAIIEEELAKTKAEHTPAAASHAPPTTASAAPPSPGGAPRTK